MRGFAAGLLALLLSISLGARSAEAQGAEEWTFARGGETHRVAVSRVEGYAALPLEALTHLGARVESARGQARIRIAGADMQLTAGSPFFSVGGSVRQMVDPPYLRGGSFWVPLQLVVDHLPGAGGVTADPAARTARVGAPAAPARAAAPVQAPAPRAEQPARAPARAAAEPAPRAAPPSRASPGTPAARRLVVIDAGHGGVDPGARGPSGVREKDVALAVAQRLATILRQDPGVEVRMTRDRDTLIALTDRTRMANSWRADGQPALFMSIHANAHERSSVRGFETFFLSEARTDDARRVAQMENAAQRFERPDRSLDPLSFIILDLKQNRYLRDSSAWAAMVQERLAAVHPGPNRGVKQAGFVVLNGAFMPAVLVELGFITHPEEERMLVSAEHQNRMARQLAAAVRDFFENSDAQASAR
jgi:N-acetylmuramoyl-L-alanine amidase